MTQAVTESAARTEAVMVRQNGERIVHFDIGNGSACWLVGESAELSTDPRETTCGTCLRQPAWKQAWKDAAKKVSAP